MKVIVADVLGLCFGVREALEAIDRVDHPPAVTIHGELVHNESILEDLRCRGFHMLAEAQRRPMPATPTVLITAHGISQRERQRLQAAGKKLLDTTCPLVLRAHQAARQLQGDGYFVLLVGRRGHVEVQGIVEDLQQFEVLEGPQEVGTYPSRKLGLLCQTTMPERLVAAVRQAVADRNPHADIRFIDTVCQPTKAHQQALDDLLDRVEAVVVVGGHNSHNTRQLAWRCQERGRPAFHVQAAADLQPAWFADCDTVGLTAGTSTPDQIIKEVHQALLTLGQAQPPQEHAARLPALVNI